ncbi:CU044_5270 family protein [Microbispora sp. NBC_01189]|uniref:CU044_5270 family protein n=1 Tax=Microbispora sp. NBC_01189 TaxID=2903583 RepID=UPI002E14848D|nr:CU044_5270 family protein [Microbispora sp. NBC_01189]
MNAHQHRGTDQPADRRDELPVPASSNLDADRFRILREHFMAEIVNDERRTSPAPRVFRTRPRPVLAGLAAAAALAVGAAVLLAGAVPAATPEPGRRPAGTSVAASRLAVVPLGAASSDDVSGQLERISLVAARSSAEGGRYSYRRTQYAFAVPVREQTMPGEGPMEMQPMVRREIWVEQRRFNGKGLIIDNGRQEEYDQGDVDYRHRYEELATLPTGPDKLLKAIYADPETKEGDGTTRQQRAFDTIGTLLEQEVLPPALGAALYRTVARIPGVTIVDRSQDAAGREGIAVAREDKGARTEWIFDRTTLEYLGRRKVQTEDTRWLKKGMLLATTAVLDRAMVDKLGARP